MDKASQASNPYLIILWDKFVQALLNDVIAVEILDEDYYVQTESHDDRMDLSIVFEVSLLCPPVSD